VSSRKTHYCWSFLLLARLFHIACLTTLFTMRSADDSVLSMGGSNGAPINGQSQMPSVVNGINGVAQSYAYPENPAEESYRVLDQYHSRPRRLRVACVGAGASGLCLAYKMEKMLEAGSWELTLFDKNKEFGGTWYENTYPGVACDIPVSRGRNADSSNA